MNIITIVNSKYITYLFYDFSFCWISEILPYLGQYSFYNNLCKLILLFCWYIMLPTACINYHITWTLMVIFASHYLCISLNKFNLFMYISFGIHYIFIFVVFFTNIIVLRPFHFDHLLTINSFDFIYLKMYLYCHI